MGPFYNTRLSFVKIGTFFLLVFYEVVEKQKTDATSRRFSDLSYQMSWTDRTIQFLKSRFSRRTHGHDVLTPSGSIELHEYYYYCCCGWVKPRFDSRLATQLLFFLSFVARSGTRQSGWGKVRPQTKRGQTGGLVGVSSTGRTRIDSSKQCDDYLSAGKRNCSSVCQQNLYRNSTTTFSTTRHDIQHLSSGTATVHTNLLTYDKKI